MKLNQLGIQLYTVRDYCQTPSELAASLKRLRTIGYTVVESAGTGKMSIKEFRSICEGEGFKICSAHEDPNSVLNEAAKVADRVREYGCNLVAYPYPSGIDLSQLTGVKQLAEKLERSAQFLKEQGIRLVYHNHGMEFAHVDGKPVLEVIYQNAPTLNGEIDTCWVQSGGGSPVDWCRRLAGRLPIVHLKDYGYVLEKRKSQELELGAGNLDFGTILATATAAGCDWFVVEDDQCRPEIFESVARSYAYIRQLIS